MLSVITLFVSQDMIQALPERGLDMLLCHFPLPRVTSLHDLGLYKIEKGSPQYKDFSAVEHWRPFAVGAWATMISLMMVARALPICPSPRRCYNNKSSLDPARNAAHRKQLFLHLEIYSELRLSPASTCLISS